MWLLTWTATALGVTVCEDGVCGACEVALDEPVVSRFAAAVNAVNTEGATVIHVCPGLFSGGNTTILQKAEVVFEPGAHLDSGALYIMGDGTTIVNWQSSPNTPTIITVQADNVTFDGITALGKPDLPWSYLISTSNSRNLVLQNVEMRAQAGENNYTLAYLFGGSTHINGLTVEGSQRGQLLTIQGGSLEIKNATLTDVTSTLGIGAPLISSAFSDLVITTLNVTGPAQQIIRSAQSAFESPYTYGYTTDPPNGAQEGSLSLSDVSLALTARTGVSWDGRVIEGSSLRSASISGLVTSGDGGIYLEDMPIAEITGSRFRGDGGLSPIVLALDGVDSASIEDSWFCGSAAGNIAPVSLTASCGDQCAIARTVFSDTFGAEGGAVFADGGALTIQRTTFVSARSFGDGGTIGGREALSLTLDHVLFAASESDRDIIGGRPQVTVHSSSFDEPPMSGALAGAQLGIAPVWLDDPLQEEICGQSVLLAEQWANRWLIDNRVGAFVPCWVDEDGDGFGGPARYDTLEECEVAEDVYTGGDCDDAEDVLYPGHGCPLDLDEDGVDYLIDCDDEDPEVGECALRFSGGCQSAPVSNLPLWLALPLWLRRSARRSRSS